MKRVMGMAGLFVLSTGICSGAIIVNESFNGFADGPLVAGHPSWTAISGGDGSVTVSSGVVALGSGAEDVERDVGEQTGTLYGGLDVTVSTAAASAYVFGFRDGSSYVTRIFLDDVSGGYQVGVNSGGTGNESAGAFAANVLTVGQTYRIVFAYDQASLVRAWINPSAGDEATPDVQFSNASASGIDAFFFRQGDAWDSGSASWQADNLTVATTFAEAVPEPATLAFLGAGTLVALAYRRRRQGGEAL